MKNNNIIPERKPMRKVSGNFQRFFAILKKFFKTTIRDKPLYFFMFGYPLIFMILLSMGAGNIESDYTVAIINYDGVPYDTQTSETAINGASILIINLFNSSESNITSITATYGNSQIEESEAINATLRGELDGVFIIPKNFSEIILGYEIGTPSFIIYTRPDPIIRGILPSVFQSIVDAVILAYEDVEGVEYTQIDATPAISTDYIDYLMPALVIAGVTVAIMNVASLFALEKQNGLMQRLDTTPVPRYIQLLGGAGAQLVFSSIQILILMGSMFLFGTQFAPNPNWFLAFLNAFIAAFSCIGIGLIIAAIVKDANSAGGLSWVAILPLQFLSGVFGMTPTKGIPTTYAVNAMRKILISGLGFADVWFDLLINLLYGIGFMIIGLLIFQKKSKI